MSSGGDESGESSPGTPTTPPPEERARIREIASPRRKFKTMQRSEPDRPGPARLSETGRQSSLSEPEATQTHSHTVLGRCKPGDELFLGVQKLPISWGVCPHTMSYFTDSTGTMKMEGPNIVADSTRCIINDLQAEPDFRDRPYVQGFPYMRSFAEVPLVSNLGYCIGSYCISDSRLREFDIATTIETLNETARLIMCHLDLRRARDRGGRAQSLMGGLSSFLEQGHKVSRDDGDDPSSNARSNSTGVDQNKPAPSAIAEDDSTSYYTRTTSTVSRNDKRPDYFNRTHSVLTRTSMTSPMTSPVPVTDVDPLEGVLSTTLESAPIAPNPPSLSESPIAQEVGAALGRAAALVAEAMRLDGVLFLDACPTGYASGSKRRVNNRTDDPFLSGSAEDSEQAAGAPELPVRILAASERELLTPKGVTRTDLVEDVLQRLVKRYPCGHIFSADEFGLIDEQYGCGLDIKSEAHTPPPKGSSSRSDAEQLFRLRPKARLIVFLPMWHFSRQAWFSAILAYSNKATIDLDYSDLSYLAAFANSVMAEVSRHEALAVSKAKSDFISNVSHELRSPLHGILASAELLSDSLADSPQALSVVEMISSCGTLLLDTMQHLLEHAKINSLSKPVGPGGDRLSALHIQEQASLIVPTDLSDLVQEVVETVFHGHFSKFSSQASAQAQNALTASAGHFTREPPEYPVLVTMDIQERDAWLLKINVGAWKRIVMNLVSNALKYTQAGSVEIGLSLIDPSTVSSLATPRKTGKPYLCFSVKDTGIGVSADFLKYHLFTPFMQESHLSPGTGLGLSIVHQIVRSLGGTLHVQSMIGVGTHVRAFLPADFGAPDEIKSSLSRSIDPEMRLRGRKLTILPIERYPWYAGASFEAREAGTQRIKLVHSTVKNIAGHWLGMEVMSSLQAKTSQQESDFVLFDAAVFGDQVDERWEKMFPASQALAVPKVLLCYHSTDFRASYQGTAQLRHPLGPRRLASVLLQALDPGASSPDETNSSTSTATAERQTQSEFHRIEPQIGLLTLGPSPTVAPTARNAKPHDHLLLVDDNYINLKLLTAVVHRLGYPFMTASNGLEAVQLHQANASTTPFTYILLDISMPVMDGFTAAREIRGWEREHKPGARVRIVALTGLGSDESQHEAKTSGFDLFLTKPVRMKEIKAILNGERDADFLGPDKTT